MRLFFENARLHFWGKLVVGAEIGVAIGDNSQNVLSNWDGISKLFLVDSYSPTGALSADEQFRNKAKAAERLSSYKNAEFIFKDSVSAAADFEDECLDFVYIDADHHRKAVLDDIMAWWPKVSAGGIIGGHDFDSREDQYGVLRAVSSWATDMGLKVTFQNSDWWVIK